MKKTLWTLISIAAVLVLVVSISKSSENVPIKVGVAVGLTGYADEWGQGELRAISLVFDEVNAKGGIAGQPVELVVEDTKSDGVGTTNTFSKLVRVDKVPVIIGPTWGDSYQGGYPIAQQAGVAVVTPSAAMEPIENKQELSVLFSTWWPQVAELNTLAAHMRSNGSLNVALVYDKDAFNSKMAELFADLAKDPLKIVAQEVVPIGTSDFRTTIAKVKSLKPQAILVIMQDTSQVGPFMKQLKELKVLAEVYSTASTENQGNLDKFPGFFDGIYYTSPKITEDAAYKQVLEAYSKKYGSAPTGPSFVNAYNAARAVAHVLQAGARTGEEIRIALSKIDILGVGMGRISFDGNGQIGSAEFKMKTIESNEFVEVK